MKPITAITVLLLVVASLLVAGCTTSTNTQTSSATPSAATHDVLLETVLAARKNLTDSDTNVTVKTWEVTWINGTSARLQQALFNKTLNMTMSIDTTYIVFPTSQDATNSLDAVNKTAYSLASTVSNGSTYQNATGHAPQIYKRYEYNEESSINVSEYKYHQIEQTDNIITIATAQYVVNS